jgi:ADP-heptose:LPS heptosyltransferase
LSPADSARGGSRPAGGGALLEAVAKRKGLPDLATRDERSILVIRLKALGDIVLSLPIVYALRARYPSARIRYLVRPRYAEALSGVRELDEVLALPAGAAGQASLALRLRREQVDCVIDLLSSPRSAFLSFLTGAATRIGMDTRRRNAFYTHVIPRVLMRDGKRLLCYTLESNRELVRILGLRTVPPEGLAIGFPAADREKGWARNYLRSAGLTGRVLVGIVPGAAYQAKSWPEERFADVARLAQSRLGADVVVLWGPGEEAVARRVAAGAPGAVVAPPMGIPRLGALIAALDCLVGIDSGPKHLAVIQGVPTVTLFGPTDPRIWDPMTAGHRVVTRSVDCFPCRKRSCRGNRCLSEVSSDAVLAELLEVLGAGAGGGPGGGPGARKEERA